jgi:peptide/nickel transport system ATP-binding protein
VSDELMRVEGLKTHIQQRSGAVVKAVDGVSLTVHRGEIVGLVGESGSGKTLTCLSLIRLLPVSNAKIVAGSVVFDGVDLLGLSDDGMRQYRGARIAMVMQDPLSALTPVIPIGEQVGEPLRYHRRMSAADRRARVIEVMSDVRIPRPEERLGEYPHQFSGGMRQRIVTAMGLSTSPDLIIADEPTTALDVTIQAQLLALVREIRDEYGTSFLWITHDLGVVAQLCDRVNIMYAGRIVESGSVERVFTAPEHPYTRALLDSIPKLGEHRERLYQIEGQPPDLADLPPGCPFYDRCPKRSEICRTAYPGSTAVGDGYVHCWNAPSATQPEPVLDGATR